MLCNALKKIKMPTPSWIDAAMNGAIAASGAITQGGPKRQFKWNKRLAEEQNRMNRENSEWMLEQNKLLQADQRKYDSPAEQMARYKAAGLNPNLIYGQTPQSSQMVSVGNLPGANMGSVDASYPDVAGRFISAMQAQSGIDLQRAKTTLTEMQTQATAVQTDIAKANPMLNPTVAAEVANGMIAIAQTKQEENGALWTKHYNDDGSYMQLGTKKIESEVNALIQKLGLNTADLAIKNKILESKEFENAIKEVQRNWLKDGDLSPEHIRQGLMMLLSNFMK